MKKIARLFLAPLFGLILFAACKQKPSAEAITAFNSVTPVPVSATLDGGTFFLSDGTSIGISPVNDDTRNVAGLLQDLLRPATGFEFALEPGNKDAGILLELKEDAAQGDEGYSLTVSEDQIRITANKAAGIFYGIQTLRQLLPASIESKSKQDVRWEIATGQITDKPGYGWRGSMLDVARHFFTIDDVKRYIDLIAMYKMNIFHLHLTDDQGWRIEIKSWPNLALHGGSTEVGGAKAGFFTQEQYKDIIAYAQKRYITVIPEIDMPGHLNSALASYGELNGGTIVPEEGRVKIVQENPILGKEKNKPTELYTGTEVGWSTLRLENKSSIRFINDVMRELAEITPGPYLHFGGDEAHVTKKSDYIGFVKLFSDIAKTNKKILVGWEEIGQGEIDENAIAQHWANVKYAQMAAEKGAKIIMSPSTRVYIDMQYDSLSRIGLHWAAYIEADHAYNWDPATQVEGIDPEQILGVETPLWSETITDMEDIEYLLFPRVTAVAEIGWSPAAARNWENYRTRIAEHGVRWKKLGIDYYPSKKIDWKE